MAIERTCLLGVLLAVSGPAAHLHASDERIERLSSEHRKWLEEEVPYIIIEPERDAFLSIETLELRDRFIDAFWGKRDPKRATPENEFKTEHYRRLRHAEEFLGRETSIPGWKTDRGRYYIILGEPQSIQPFDGYRELVSIELWFYQSDPADGLPPFFYLMFFKPRDVGAYRLYRPVTDGPTALLQPAFGRGPDPGPAIDELLRVSPEIAQAALNFDASDAVDLNNGRPSLGSEIMLARIEDLPKRFIRADYADAFLRYGSRVASEYSFNFIPNRSYFAVLPSAPGSFFVHFAVEIDPQDFTVETDEKQSKFYTTLDLDIEVRDNVEQRLVMLAQRELYIELSPSQFEQVQRSPYSIQDGFPLVPGDHRVTVTLRNRVQKRFTVAEHDVHVPELSDGPAFTGLIVGYQQELEAGENNEGRPFRVGGIRINPAPDGILVLGETIQVLSQYDGVPHGNGAYKVRSVLRNDEQTVDTAETSLGDDQGGGPGGGPGGVIVQSFSMIGASAGNYELSLELVDDGGRVVDKTSTPVRVSPRAHFPRPSFIYRRRFDTSPGAVALAEGEQCWNLGRKADARRKFETAVAATNPPRPSARWKLAAVLVSDGEMDRALQLLAPLENDFPNEFEVVAGLGLAHYFKGDFEKALDYLERAVTLREPQAPLLNALGDTYQQLGRGDEARAVYERSLGLDPEQTIILERLETLREGG